MSKHTYFALDSDVLRNISKLDDFITNHPELTPAQIRNVVEENDKGSPMIKNLDVYLKLLTIVKSEDPSIRLLVTKTTFKETEHIESVRKFIIKHCYSSNLKDLRDSNIQTKIRDLAKAYCQPFEKLGRKFPPPMQVEHCAYVDYGIPGNDAYIMAEATFYGACLLTENVKDFIAKKSGYRTLEKESYHTHQDNIRVRWIVDINILHGYGQEATDSIYGEDSLNVPKPCSMRTFGRFINDFDKYKSNYTVTDDERVKKESELEQ